MTYLTICVKNTNINKYEGWRYTTLIFYRTILPKNKDTNTIQNQIIYS